MTKYRIVQVESRLAIEMIDPEGYRTIIRSGISSYNRAVIIKERYEALEAKGGAI